MQEDLEEKYNKDLTAIHEKYEKQREENLVTALYKYCKHLPGDPEITDMKIGEYSVSEAVSEMIALLEKQKARIEELEVDLTDKFNDIKKDIFQSQEERWTERMQHLKEANEALVQQNIQEVAELKKQIAEANVAVEENRKWKRKAKDYLEEAELKYKVNCYEFDKIKVSRKIEILESATHTD